jgi:hypothetical protein
MARCVVGLRFISAIVTINLTQVTANFMTQTKILSLIVVACLLGFAVAYPKLRNYFLSGVAGAGAGTPPSNLALAASVSA